MELTKGQINYRRYKNSYKKYYEANKEQFKAYKKEYRDNTSFGGRRNEVLLRDGYKCVKCGMSNEEHISMFNRELTIHHIDGKGRGVKEKNNELENLITLCLRCHGDSDIQRRSWRKVRLDEEKVRYIRKAYPKVSVKELAGKFGVQITSIYKVLEGTYFKWVKDKQ